VSRLGVSISLLNQRSVLERVLEPTPMDENSLPVTGLALSPQTVTVRVPIEKQENYRRDADQGGKKANDDQKKIRDSWLRFVTPKVVLKNGELMDVSEPASGASADCRA